MIDLDEYDNTVRQYGRPLFRYCYLRLFRDISLTEEVVDDVFVALFRKWERLDRSSDLRPWLYRAADIQIKDRRKRLARGGRSVSLDELVEEGIDPSEEDSYFADRLDDEALIRTVAERLPERFREIFVLRFADGLTLEQIATKTGIPYSSVRRRLEKMGPAVRKLISELT